MNFTRITKRFCLHSALLLSVGSVSLAANEMDASQVIDAREYIATFCTLEGNWAGEMEQYRDGAVFRSSDFEAWFACQPGKEVLIESNTFFQDPGSTFPTLKVIFPVDLETGSTATMQLSYFFGGMERVYSFDATELDFVDDENWTVTRRLVDVLNPAAEAPPVSRYIHIREGDTLIMIRQVKPDQSTPDWSLSSQLTLRLQP